MSDVVLRLEESVEAEVSLAFAWQFRTDVSKWDDPPADLPSKVRSKPALAEQQSCPVKIPCTG